MWDKLLNMELTYYMIRVTKETEDEESIQKFYEHIKSRTENEYKLIVVLATQWSEYDDTKQANVAIKVAGMNHASRFIIMMDYLSSKYRKGKLK